MASLFDSLGRTVKATGNFFLNDILKGAGRVGKEVVRSGARAAAIPATNVVQELRGKHEPVDLPFVGRIEPFGTEAAAKQSLGSALETATAFLPLGVFSKFGTTAAKTGTQAVKQAVKNTAADSLFGAAAGAGTELVNNPDATGGDLLKSTLLGAGIGALPTTVGETSKVLTSETGKILKYIQKKAGSPAVKWLERTAQGAAKGQPVSNMADEFIRIGRGNQGKQTPYQKVMQPIAQTAIKGANKVKNFEEYFIDKFVPIQRLEKAAALKVGRELNVDERAYLKARLFAGVGGKVENRLDDFQNILLQNNDVKDELRAYMLAQDFIERGTQGLKLPGGKTVEQAKQALVELEERLGADRFTKIKTAAQDIYNYQDTLLRERVEAGLLSKDQYLAIKSKHKNYIPHDVADFIDTEIDSSLFPEKRFSVTSTDIKKAKGSERDITDPFEAIIRRTSSGVSVSERNKVGRSVIDLGRDLPEFGFQKLSAPIKEVDIPKGQSKVSVYRDGIKEDWLVPDDIGRAMRGLGSEKEANIFFRLLAGVSNVFRAGTTRYNPSFIVTNLFRDTQTAASIAKEGLTPQNWVRALGTQFGIGSDDIQRLFKETGGSTNFMIREGRTPTQIIKDIERKAAGKAKVRDNVVDVVMDKAGNLNPLRLMDQVGTKLENASRLAVFERSLQRGMNPLDAAFEARNATVDFARMGHHMQSLNRVIPFLNARVQGVLNVGRAIKRDPTTFLRRQYYQAVWPTIALTGHNLQFQSYDKIPLSDRDRYWNFIVGETKEFDDEGNAQIVPIYVRIPKGEAQMLISSGVEELLNIGARKQNRKVLEVLTDVGKQLSPVNISENGSIVSSMGPVPSLIYGLSSNKDPFFGTPLVPENRVNASPKEQYNPYYTSETAKKVGAMLNISPAKLEFVLKNIAGTVSTDIFKGGDVLSGILGDDQTKKDVAGSLPSSLPFVSKFLAARRSDAGTLSERRQKTLKKKIERTATDANLKVKAEAQKIYDELQTIQNYDERIYFLNQLEAEGKLTEPVRKEVNRLKEAKRGSEVLSPYDSVEVRAQYISARLKQIGDYDDRVNFLEDMESAGVLTESVRKRIAELKAIQ